MVSHEQKRLERIALIKNTIAKAKVDEKHIDKELFITELCGKWGSTRRTVLEYLRIAGYS